VLSFKKPANKIFKLFWKPKIVLTQCIRRFGLIKSTI
jgi:hypothetical protein